MLTIFCSICLAEKMSLLCNGCLPRAISAAQQENTGQQQAQYDRMGTHAAKGKGMGRDHAFIYTIASQLPDAAPEHLGSVKQLHSSAVIGAIKLGAR